MAKESGRQLVGAAIQEFAGSLLMFLLSWPFVGVFGNTWTAWVAHFFFVMLSDVISGGAQVNPSVSVSMFVHGAISFPGMLVRIASQLGAAFVAFPMLEKLTPKYVGIGGPQLVQGVTPVMGAASEFTMAFLLLTLIYVACNVVGLPGQRPIIAAGVRGLIILGGKYSGPAMNPMVAFAWAWHTSTWKSFDHYLVYWVAPTVGGVVATVLFALLQAGFSAKEGKRKDD